MLRFVAVAGTAKMPRPGAVATKKKWGGKGPKLDTHGTGTCPHALRVEDLVPAANLEDGGEVLGIVLKAPVPDHLLTRLVVRRHGQTCNKLKKLT